MRPLERLAGLGLAIALAACAAAPEPPQHPAPEPAPPAPASDPKSPAQRILALLTEDNPRLVDLAVVLHRMGDAAALREASARLLAMARERLSEDFRDRLHNARSAARAGKAETLSPWAVEARIDAQRDEALVPVLEAMRWVGGPEVVAFSFELAGNEAIRWRAREKALEVLDQNVDPRNEQEVRRRDAIAARLGALERSRASTDVAGAWMVSSRARRCAQLRFDSDAGTTKVVLTLEIDVDGTVVGAVAEGDVSDKVLRCIEAAGSWVTFPRAADVPSPDLPADGPRKVSLSFSFVVVRPR